MPLYDLRCTGCGKVEADVYHGIRDPHPASKCCKAPTESAPAHFHTDRIFSGSKRLSWKLAFHPDEVKEAQREIPSLDVDEKGRVYFNSRGHERTVMREIQSLRDRADQAVDQAGEQLGHEVNPRDIAEVVVSDD